MYRERAWKLTKTRSKYKNKPKDQGRYTYHSIKEAKYAQDLGFRQKAGDIQSWERQVKVQLFGEHGSHVCDYYVDFLVHHNDGHLEYVEVKGFQTDVWRLKWKLFEDKFKGVPDVELTIVK